MTSLPAPGLVQSVVIAIGLHRSTLMSDRSADSTKPRADESGVMNVSSPLAARSANTRGHAALRTALILFIGFLLVSVATLVAIVVMRDDPALVTETVWIRCSLVLSSSVVTLIFMIVAIRGSRASFNRTRLISAIILIAVCVIVAIPGFLPTWVWIEQVTCGMLLLPAVIALNLPSTRALFPKQA